MDQEKYSQVSPLSVLVTNLQSKSTNLCAEAFERVFCTQIPISYPFCAVQKTNFTHLSTNDILLLTMKRLKYFWWGLSHFDSIKEIYVCLTLWLCCQCHKILSMIVTEVCSPCLLSWTYVGVHKLLSKHVRQNQNCVNIASAFCVVLCIIFILVIVWLCTGQHHHSSVCC